MEQTRYQCLVDPCCRKSKDFSLITLYEHLAYHLKDRGYTEHFEYRCVQCKALFTNKIFMVRHKMEPEFANHEIERLPEIDLIRPQDDEKLKRAVTILSDELLRYKFKAVVPNVRCPDGNYLGTPRTPRECNSSYSPYTPRTPLMSYTNQPSYMRTPQRTPGRFGNNSALDFSNSFANATPARSANMNSGFGTPNYNINGALLQNINPNMPPEWQLAAFREALGLPNNDLSRTPGRFRDADNGFEGGCGYDNFGGNRGFNNDRGGGHERGGSDRDFDRRDSGFSGGRGGRGGFRGDRDGGFRGGRVDRDGGFRGGRGGDRDSGFRGRGGDRGRGGRGGDRDGGFRGRGGDRGRGGRGGDRKGGFRNGREEDRDRDFRVKRSERGCDEDPNNNGRKSRSRSPLVKGKSPSSAARCSYSRSRSNSPDKSERSTSPQDTKNVIKIKKDVRRSYSRSPKSD